jgi:hypothetical protein
VRLVRNEQHMCTAVQLLSSTSAIPRAIPIARAIAIAIATATRAIAIVTA